jgi:hypothetical protein
MTKHRRISWIEHVTQMRMMKNACRILVLNPEQKELLRRAECRWKDNIKIDLRKMCYEDVHGTCS